ncbi:MAG: heavy-metal-associated domain-containing protein [Spirochaetaceae bacterium]|jgi:Cu+-exporting ATPase|nr:heavy-metal-associated domain-containing protein [Spirochaetaceae bacterium]
MKTITLGIGGMSCAACVRHVEKALSKLDGVDNAFVNLATEKATVRYDEAKLDFAAMQAAVDDAGYEAFELDAMGQSVGADNDSAPAKKKMNS